MREGMLQVLAVLFAERNTIVRCGGYQGYPIRVKYFIYQCIICGPWLWNLFYEDARLALLMYEFQETLFADDINIFRVFF